MARNGVSQNREENCPKCNSLLFYSMNSQLYCQTCKYSPQFYEKQLKVVPQGYRPNSLQSLSRTQSIIQKYLRNYANICQIVLNSQEINVLAIEVIYLQKTRGRYSKGYLQHSAAVIYQTYKQNHKMSIRQFCNKSSLKLQKFNRSYLAFVSRKKNMQIKVQKNQNQQLQINLQFVQNTIQKLYNNIFKSLLFSQKKQDIIFELSKKVLETYLKINDETQHMNKYHNIICIIYIILKNIQVKISFKKYKDIVFDVFNIQIKERVCRSMTSIIKKINLDEGSTTTIGNQNSQGI